MTAERYNAKEILAFKEGNLVPKHDSVFNTIVRHFVAISLFLIVIFSATGAVNFNDFSFYAKAVYISILFYAISQRGSVRVPQNMEIWFFDDYMILYRPKCVYNSTCVRREFNKFYYKDISKIEYRTVVDKMVIYGVYEGKYFKYKRGTDEFKLKPSYHKTVDSVDRFYTMYAKDIDFLGMLKKYTGIDVEVSES